MIVVPLHKEWIEVFSGCANGAPEVRWWLEYCTADERLCVSDHPTEDEAITEAARWEMPIVRDRR